MRSAMRCLAHPSPRRWVFPATPPAISPPIGCASGSSWTIPMADPVVAEAHAATLAQRLSRSVEELGPGVISGAADDDPSGIATYSQAGAQFGYGLLWTMLLTYPLMVAVQLVSAHVGRVTGHGLAKSFTRSFPRSIVTVLVSILLAANVFNLGADLAAMGESAELVAGG